MPRRRTDPEPDPEPKHGTTSESIISWTCRCGGRWYNDRLKGKSDEQLVIEKDEAYLNHVRDMEAQGFA